MDALRRDLILRESASRLQAADALRRAGDASDSAYILRLLAFELLLKVLVEDRTGEPAPKHHRYAELFGKLLAETQTNLIQLAGERIGPSALAQDHLDVLEELGRNFIELRYPYDKYVGLSREQYVAAGDNWAVGGAKLGEATFRYHPEELLGLTHAAQQLAGC